MPWDRQNRRGAVRLLKFEGVDGLEVERRMPRDVCLTLMIEAAGLGLPGGGKVSIEVNTPARHMAVTPSIAAPTCP